MSVAPIIPAIAPVEPIQTGSQVSGGASVDFGAVFDQARALETHANSLADKFANGDTSIGIHEVMLAAEDANLALKFSTTLKNKAIEAYRELMNTQV